MVIESAPLYKASHIFFPRLLLVGVWNTRESSPSSLPSFSACDLPKSLLKSLQSPPTTPISPQVPSRNLVFFQRPEVPAIRDIVVYPDPDLRRLPRALDIQDTPGEKNSMLANSPDSRQNSYLGPTQPIPKKSLQIRTDKPRPHVCSICTRGFARLEHLKRHERSHTNEKPFQCAACGRCFARRDLVLRHQQKLHLHISQVMRRPLIALNLSQAAPESTTSTPLANENIIILHNNTNATAPLPAGLQVLSPQMGLTHHLDLSSHLLPGSDDYVRNPHIRQLFGYRGGAIPSPNTNSSLHTPNGANGRHATRLNSNPGTGLGASNTLNATQQPSPLTGDLPDLKEKKKPTWPVLDYGQNLHRHASFLAVSGLSYTNIKDALSILSHQISDGPTQVGFATPQLTAAEIDSKGLLVVDFGGLDLDWYNLELNTERNSKRDTPGSEIAPNDMEAMEHMALLNSHLTGVSTTGLNLLNDITHNVVLNGARNADINGVRLTLPGLHLRLDTIPSELLLAEKDLPYFSSLVMAAHQFQNPDHPHHIKGTTPMEFGMSPVDATRSVGTDQRSPAGHQDMALDMFRMDKNDAKRPLPAKKQKQGSVSSKRTKLGFINDTENLEWVEEMMGIPVLNEFPSASHDTGFMGLPYVANQPDEILSLFKLRQDELIRQRSQVNTRELLGSSTSRLNTPRKLLGKAQFTIGEKNTQFFGDELRNRIILDSNLNSSQFPPLEDLNTYMSLYENEFNSYYPFIHMPSLKNPMVDNFENIPLILSMCAIGALYSYHDSNTLLLFNLSKYHIHNFFEKEVTVDKLQFKKVPLMAHQCLVLHIFISMFLNEPNMVEITSRQMNSMVGLIKSTNFHRPLEQFLVPPPTINNSNETGVIQNNYDYYIMAQTRIRTIHCFYQLEVFRSALIGCPLPMSGSEIKSGTQCTDELLWKADNSRDWYIERSKAPHKKLVELSNNESMSSLFEHLNNHCPLETKMSFNKLFGLLMHVHEQILVECIAQQLKGGFNALNWRVNSRPHLTNLVKSWEVHFARNGGFSVVNNHNNLLLNTNKELKLILPLLSFAKIRLCINFTPVMEKVLYKDWKGMIEMLSLLDNDLDGVREASKHALDILLLWVHNISVLNDAKQTSVRTPVFFVTCIFIAVMVLAKALNNVENCTELSTLDKAFWINSEKILRSIETTLSPKEESNTYSEFLRKQSHGVFDYVWSEAFKSNVEKVITAVVSGHANSLPSVRSCRLLIQALSLGVRILADAPLWPLAMGFAEALKNMATQISES